MSFHPAFPTAADLAREARAITRDREDLASLATLRRIIAATIDRVSLVNPIRHPNARWLGAPELAEALEGELAELDATVQLIKRSPVVIEDEETAS